ncbi:MAG TPA: hypothetical protein VI959_00990, partial [Alphaproteobacteria bacterium]|nr:hypothetical protein [Alphaproteobacteria bacterium]
EYVISTPKLYPVLELITLLKKTKDQEIYELLKDYIVNSLQNELKQGLRNKDDWAINSYSKCGCEYCLIFNEFMNSSADINKKWPIRQDARFHIIDVIKKLEVPIDHDVEKKGSPHSLILIKSDSLHSSAKKRFETVTTAYQKLINNSNS